MKTCEEYVLKRVEELEKEVDALKAGKEKLLADLNDLKFIVKFGKDITIEDRDDDYYRVLYKGDYITLYRKNDNKENLGMFFEKIKELSEKENG